ncbi:hypothetical protein [Streptomyces sp. NPDC059893]|uniref:hypothetical protein n=1 Tax=Streptomyces sp. NPDC059893 TaxID=3346990 RepID=UPI00364ABE8A
MEVPLRVRSERWGDQIRGGFRWRRPASAACNAENFTFQALALLDQAAWVAESLPACVTFADALCTMEIIQASSPQYGS